VTNRTDQALAEFSVDPTTGLLKSLGPTVPPGGDSPFQVVADPAGQLVYLDCLGQGTVTTFGIQSDGQLKQIGSVTTDASPEGIVLVPR
jgi:6-phosphogluconolactonase (cycloisomerase 2 family)